MAIRLYYEKKQSLVGKTVYFAPGKRLARDRELVERDYHAGDHTVDREQLLDGTPCVVTAQTPNAALVFVSWQSVSGLQFSARLPLRFFRDTLAEYAYRDMYAKAKLKAEQAAARAQARAEQAAATAWECERARAIATACAIVVARAKAIAKVAKLQKKLKKALRSLASWSTVDELKAKLAKAEKKLAKLGGGGRVDYEVFSRQLAHRRERCGARVRDLGAAFLADRMDHECPGLHMAEPLQGG